jgi:hypothetical protein
VPDPAVEDTEDRLAYTENRLADAEDQLAAARAQISALTGGGFHTTPAMTISGDMASQPWGVPAPLWSSPVNFQTPPVPYVEEPALDPCWFYYTTGCTKPSCPYSHV